jgi:Tfp pilus assembly protein PilX
MEMSTKGIRQEFPKGYLRTKALDESGAAIVIALMVLVILTLMGSASIMTSITEVEIAANDKQYQMGFYASDGGADMAPRVIREIVKEHDEPVYAGNKVIVKDGLLEELMNYEDAAGNPTENNDGATDTADSNADIRIPALTTTLSVAIDIDRDDTLNLPGGAMEMGSGYEGIGSGTSGGTAILFEITSKSQGSRNTSTNISTQYLYVIGVGG